LNHVQGMEKVLRFQPLLIPFIIKIRPETEESTINHPRLPDKNRNTLTSITTPHFYPSKEQRDHAGSLMVMPNGLKGYRKETYLQFEE